MLRRLSFRVAILAVALSSVTTLVGAGCAQAPTPAPAVPEVPKVLAVQRVERYLPQKSLLFVTVRDANLLREYWKSGFLYKLWQEPEIQKALAQVKKEIDKGYEEAQEKFKGVTGATFAEFLSVFQGEVAFSLVGLDIQPALMVPPPGMEPPPGMVPPAPMGLPTIDLVFSVDAGDKKDALIKIIEKTQETVTNMAGGVAAATSYQYKEQTIYRFGMMQFGVSATFLGTRYFLTTDKKTLEGIIDRYYSAEVKDSLDTNPVFKKVREKCCPPEAGSEVFFVFADLPGLLGSVKDSFPPEMSKAFASQGLFDIQGAGYASCLDKSGLTRDISYTYAPGERKGFYSARIPGASIDTNIYFPPECVIAYFTGSLDVEAMWSETLEILSASDEAGGKDTLGELKGFEEKLGFSIEKDLLPGIGTRFSYYIGLPEGGGALPEAVALLEVKDKEKLTKCVDLLVAKLGEKVKKTEFAGSTLHYAALSDLVGSAKERETPIPYFPALIITDKYLVIGTMPQTVKRTAASVAQPAIPTGSLKDALANLPQGASSFFYADLEKAGGYLYNTLTLFLKDLPEGAPEIDLGALPEAKTITRHLGTISGYEVVDKEGIHSELISSFGPSAITLYPLVVAAITIPNMLEVRSSAYETGAAATLRNLATTVEVSRVKFGDYPASEISPRDTKNGARLLFEAQDDFPDLEGVQDCRTLDPSIAQTYTFTYTRLGAEKWTCTADTNRKDLLDFFIAQSGVLHAAPSTGDGCQANEESEPYDW